MKSLIQMLDIVVNVAAWIAGLAAVLMMLHVTADVAGRNFFNAPITGTLEIVSAYHMAALAFLPLALIARERGHIIVELFTTWMKPNPRAILDGLVAIITVLYVAAFTWKAVEVAIEKTHIREAKEAGIGFVDIWPARWLVAIGFGLMLIYVAYHMLRDLRNGLTGRATDHDDPTHIPGGEDQL